MFDPLKYEAGEFKKLVNAGMLTSDELVSIMQKAFRDGWGKRLGSHLNLLDNIVFQASDAAIAQHVNDQLNS